MPFSLLPGWIVPDLPSVLPESLQRRGIRLLLLDFDNTILPYTSDELSPQMASWLVTMREAHVLICVVSNTRKNRAPDLCREWGIPCITHANKPFGSGIRRALRQFRVRAKNAALAGDQIFTDTLGANRAGLLSILVRPIDNHNFWLKVRHALEMPFIFLAKKKGREKL